MTDITTLVKLDLDQREKVGRQRYGGPLYAHTKDKPLQEAYEEALDLCVYLKAFMERDRTSRNVNEYWEAWNKERERLAEAL